MKVRDHDTFQWNLETVLFCKLLKNVGSIQREILLSYWLDLIHLQVILLVHRIFQLKLHNLIHRFQTWPQISHTLCRLKYESNLLEFKMCLPLLEVYLLKWRFSKLLRMPLNQQTSKSQKLLGSLIKYHSEAPYSRIILTRKLTYYRLFPPVSSTSFVWDMVVPIHEGTTLLNNLLSH